MTAHEIVRILMSNNGDGHSALLDVVCEAMRLAGASEPRRVAFLEAATSGGYGHLLRTVGTVLKDTFSTVDPAVTLTPEWEDALARIEKYLLREREKINKEKEAIFDCTGGKNV